MLKICRKELHSYESTTAGNRGCIQCRLADSRALRKLPSEKAKRNARYKKNPMKPEEIRAKNLKQTFGLTIEQYNQMFIDQAGCCAGCNRPQSAFKWRFAVDHDHTTGVIRGLLCNACNLSLGKLKDSISTLKNLINYLEKPDLNSNVIQLRRSK